MGYRVEFHTVFDVEVSSECREMLSVLSESPYRVFNEPYLGYLLFLFTDIDRNAQAWLDDHALGLDSLTGTDVCFAIFSARIPFSANAITAQRKRSSRRPQGSSDAIEIWQIQELVKNGHLELAEVKPGAELFAVNEAVFFIAREMGLTRHLPCVVAFDGLPHPDLPWLCIPIQDQHASHLYRVIQGAVGTLQTHPNVRSYREGIHELSALPKQIEKLKSQESELRWQLARERRAMSLLLKEYSSSYAGGFQQCREAVERGQGKHHTVLVTKLAKQFPHLHLDVGTLSSVPWSALTRYRKTIHMLGRYAAKPWPLPADELARLSKIYSIHARTLAEDLPARVTWESQAQIEETRQGLVELWKTQIENAMEKFPRPSETMLANERAQCTQLQTLAGEVGGHDARLQELAQMIEQTELSLVESSRRILDLSDRPSFCELLGAECKSAGIDVVPSLPPESEPKANRQPSFWTSWLPVNGLLQWLSSRSFYSLPKAVQPVGASADSPYWHQPPTAFASYASADRQEVLRRIQGMRAWQPGLDVFLDFHSLFPGERWKNRLEEEILKRDRFLLFWSKAASESEYVNWEWRTALKCRGLPFITPVPLEAPDQAQPPAELADLHFNDLYVEMLRYSRASHIPSTGASS